MKKLAIPLLVIVAVLYFIRGTWDLLGNRGYFEYYRFDMLRVFISQTILILVLGFIRSKIKQQPLVQTLILIIMVIEGLKMCNSILAIGTLLSKNYDTQTMVIGLARWAMYIVTLIMISASKYNRIKRISKFRYFIISIIAVEGAIFTVGLIVGLTRWHDLSRIMWYFYCVPIIFLMVYLHRMKNVGPEDEHPMITPEWKPE